MSVNADSMHAIKGKVCLLMLTSACYQRQSVLMLTSWVQQRQNVSVNVNSMDAIKGKVCLLMLTSCMLSKAKWVC